MVDFFNVNLNGVNGINPASAAPGSGQAGSVPGFNPLNQGGVDAFTPSNALFAGQNHGVDFNAIANMSLEECAKALPHSFAGLQFLANL